MNRILLALCLLCHLTISAQEMGVAAADGSSANITNTSSLTQQSTWDEKENYVNGFARVLKNSRFSFVNPNNNLICALQFEDARNFKSGLAAVKLNSKWGFINATGKIVVACKYDLVYDYDESATAVMSANQWVIINKTGVTISSPDIDVCYGFKNGKARIQKSGKMGEMNRSGAIRFTGELAETVASRNGPVSTNASANCPQNIDFENGDFTNWDCFTGDADSIGTTNVIRVVPSAPVPGRQRVYNRVMPSAIDAYGLFPTNPPDGSNHAVKLGNTRIGGEAERIQYTLRIPANDSNFSIRYDYAVVFQDPGHTEWTQPRFTAKLFDSAANTYIECASFEYISTSSLPGFEVSPVDTAVIYKAWSSVFISLRGHAGRTLYLQFTTADCVRKGHWGYAYVDVESACSHSIDVNYECTTGVASLNGPPGFQHYNWWNNNYSSLLGTGQHLVLNPAPPINSTIWLEMIPFSDFGCNDTLPAMLTGSFNPHFDASERTATCAPHSFTFYNRDVTATSVTWDFGDGTTGTGDTVYHVYALPGTYTVTMHVTMPGGCSGSFSDSVSITQPALELNYTGGNYCNTIDANFTLTGAMIDSVRWNFGDGTTITNNLQSATHTYLTPGIYVPQVTATLNAACTVVLPSPDTIKVEIIRAGFNFSTEARCGSTTIHFTDNSSSAFGTTVESWEFGDGITGTGSGISHTYTTAGTYNVRLIVKGQFGCRDTVSRQVNVSISAAPVISIAGPATSCLNTQAEFIATVESADGISTQQWSLSNGGAGSGNNFQTVFTQPGSYSVILIVGTVNGCYDTATRQVTVQPLALLDPPANIEICNAAIITPDSFSGSTGASFAWTNSDTSINLAGSGVGDITSFVAVNNSGAAVSSLITVTASVNNCPGETKSFEIKVLPSPSVTQPADQVVCNRAATEAVIFNNFSGATALANYSWTNSEPGIGLAANGTGNIPAFNTINTGVIPQVATITLTATNSGCSSTPQTFTITVNPTPTVGQPADIQVCNQSAVGSIAFESNIAGSGFSWLNNHTGTGLPVSGDDSIPAFQAVNPGATPIVSTITLVAEAYGCHSTPVNFALQVNPTPSIAQPLNESVCTGATTSAISFTSTVSNTVFEWTNDQPAIGLAATGSGNILSFNPNNPGASPLTAHFQVIPVAAGCEGEGKSFSITVLPAPVVIQPLNQFQCNGENTAAVNFLSPVPNTSFAWTNSLPAIGIGAAGTGSLPSFTGMNPTNAAITATFTVTPSTSQCAGQPKSFSISIDPTPDLVQPVNHVVCRGEQVDVAAFTGTVNGTTYTWINSASEIGLPANGTGNVPSFRAENTTAFPITAVVQVTGNANSCGSVVRVFTITVYPTPLVNAVNDEQVCKGIATPAIPLTGPVSGTAYSWKNDNPSIGLSATGTGDIPSFIAQNTQNEPAIANIIVYGSSNNCTVAIDTFIITVDPLPAVTAGADQNVCLGRTTTLQASGATQFSWSPSIGLSCVDCPNPTVTAADSIRYFVKGVGATGCIAYDSVFLMIRKPFDMAVSNTDTVCAGMPRTLSATNANSYSWSPSAGLNTTTGSTIIATPATTTNYQVIGRDAFNCFSDTAFVTVFVAPQPTVDLGPDKTGSTGHPMPLTAIVTNGPVETYEWTPANLLSCSNCPSPIASIKESNTFSLRVTNSYGCSAIDSVRIVSFCQKSEVFVPNAFTPDGDGLNDILMVRGSGIMVKSFRIFNRWGGIVFEKQNFAANDPRNGWDGKVRGTPAPTDVYVYTAEVVCDNGSVYTYKGNTTIIK